MGNVSVMAGGARLRRAETRFLGQKWFLDILRGSAHSPLLIGKRDRFIARQERGGGPGRQALRLALLPAGADVL